MKFAINFFTKISNCYYIFFLIVIIRLNIQAETYIIRNVGFTFSPDNVTINLGDTVKFVLEMTHNAVEVSEATWNANGVASNGGFSVPFGGGIVVPTEVKTYYYVCTPHAFMGMKGKIIVKNITNVEDVNIHAEIDDFELYQNYPNPFNSVSKIIWRSQVDGHVNLEVYNIEGEKLKTLVNEYKNAGIHIVEFNTANLASGIYFYRLGSGNIFKVKTMVVLK